MLPDLELSSDASSAQLTIWSYNIWINDFVEGNNTVVLLDGDTETVLWSAETVSQEWTETTIDLSAYLGQTISLAFKYAGDYGNGWYVDDVEVSVMPATQTVALSAGVNWFSTYVEITFDELKAALVEASPNASATNTIIIKSQRSGQTTYTGTRWRGVLSELVPGQGYIYQSASSTPRVLSFAQYDYVDLGLPSGLLWATCNVGADSPEEYGDYFAWGETTPKDTYYWSNYQYCNGSQITLTKYCNDANYGNNGFTDNLTPLSPEDDAATANWGSDWRMPTWEEWEELYNNRTQTWTTQNGVNGRLFTAANGNSLFLPAAGCIMDDGFEHVSGTGLYWSSSLDTDFPSLAWYYYFDFYSGNDGMDDFYIRYFGQSVRPVRVGSQN